MTIREHGEQLYLFNDRSVKPWSREQEETWDTPGSVRLALYELSDGESLFTEPGTEEHLWESPVDVSDQEMAEFVQEVEQIEGLSQVLSDARMKVGRPAPVVLSAMTVTKSTGKEKTIAVDMWICPFRGASISICQSVSRMQRWPRDGTNMCEHVRKNRQRRY